MFTSEWIWNTAGTPIQSTDNTQNTLLSLVFTNAAKYFGLESEERNNAQEVNGIAIEQVISSVHDTSLLWIFSRSSVWCLRLQTTAASLVHGPASWLKWIPSSSQQDIVFESALLLSDSLVVGVRTTASPATLRLLIIDAASMNRRGCLTLSTEACAVPMRLVRIQHSQGTRFYAVWQESYPDHRQDTRIQCLQLDALTIPAEPVDVSSTSSEDFLHGIRVPKAEYLLTCNRFPRGHGHGHGDCLAVYTSGTRRSSPAPCVPSAINRRFAGGLTRSSAVLI